MLLGDLFVPRPHVSKLRIFSHPPPRRLPPTPSPAPAFLNEGGSGAGRVLEAIHFHKVEAYRLGGPVLKMAASQWRGVGKLLSREVSFPS